MNSATNVKEGRRSDGSGLQWLFVLGFALSGGLQIAIVMFFPDTASDTGFLASGIFEGKPRDLDYGILVKTAFIWALMFTVAYWAFVTGVGSRNKVLLQNQQYLDRFRDKDTRQEVVTRCLLAAGAIVLLLWFELVGAEIYLGVFLFDLFAQTIRGIVPFCSLLLLIALMYGRGVGERVAGRSLAAALLAYLVATSILRLERGLIIATLGSLLVFYVSSFPIHMTGRRVLGAAVAGFIVFVLSTLLKFSSGYSGDIEERMTAALEAAGVEDIPSYFWYGASMALSRLNHAGTLYWYYFDEAFGASGAFVDIPFSFLAVVNQIVPAFLIDLSQYRQVAGVDLELWLFQFAYSGGAIGGFALPPFVEAIWATRSTMAGIAIASGIFWTIGMLVRGLITVRLWTYLLVVALLLPQVISPESIVTLFRLLFRSGVIASLIVYVVFYRIAHTK